MREEIRNSLAAFIDVCRPAGWASQRRRAPAGNRCRVRSAGSCPLRQGYTSAAVHAEVRRLEVTSVVLQKPPDALARALLDAVLVSRVAPGICSSAKSFPLRANCHRTGRVGCPHGGGL